LDAAVTAGETCRQRIGIPMLPVVVRAASKQDYKCDEASAEREFHQFPAPRAAPIPYEIQAPLRRDDVRTIDDAQPRPRHHHCYFASQLDADQTSRCPGRTMFEQCACASPWASGRAL